ncbi:MAG TPA: hypothetical protein VGB98_24190 [Pyrinomonadaceae bacterium]|jgi:hypothetical protein
MTATVIKMERFQCPCNNCSICRNVYHQATRYLTTAEIRAHLSGKWTPAAVDEYVRRCETGAGRIQVGDTVIIRQGFGKFGDGVYTEVAAVDEARGRVTVFNSTGRGETSLDNVSLFLPEPEPPNRGAARIAAVRITLTRVESPERETAALAAADHQDVWGAADRQLTEWGETLDREGTAHVAEEVEFTILWGDHTEYRGTYFLFHPGYEFNRGFTLADHVRDFCSWTSGRRVPLGGIESLFDREMAAADSTIYYGSILDGYQLGCADAQVPVWTAGDGFGGRHYYTRIGRTATVEWYYSSAGAWRARGVEALPAGARDAGACVPADVRAAIRSIHPELPEA